MNFALTTVQSRKEKLAGRLEKSRKLLSGEEKFEITVTGEEGVEQIRALLGLRDLVTNVNIPNVGQIPNLPLGAVVETNATFRSNELRPVMAGNIPNEIYSLISRIAGVERNLDKAFMALLSDPLVNLPIDKAREMFDEMIGNTKEYLTMYNM